ncbi:acyl-CoA dehydrogenase family protein [Kitasatospora sp. NBC_01266]|uniref:acyl-CoA dehydrogenase family protein n=1 Tax=Kitasatospora sp. NBC_01266 TaxID=2903572 RepID=UPI002E2F3971|nr:acyl-CoA dehydrogenase [Kitasatospora sp. NBC_01266]
MTIIPSRRHAAPEAPITGSGVTTADLTRQLFGPDRERIHGAWRKLTTDPRMHRRPEAGIADQIAASYQRLRLVNQVGEAIELAGDPYRLTALHEWTGPLDGALTVLVGIHYNLFLGSLVDHDPHEKRPLEGFAAMERVGTFLCTELAHGNDATALETTAVYDRADRTFTLHTPNAGAQKFMPNTSLAGGPKSAVVAARLLIEDRDHGIFLFLVPLSDEAGILPGVRVRELPLRPGSPVDHCLTAFDQLVLPREAMLCGDHGRLADDGTFTSALGSKRKRFLTSIGRVTLGKLCMSASAIGVARAALATAVRYAHHREVTGARADRRLPVWAHRTHHGPLLEGLATVYAMTALHRETVARWAEHDRNDPADAAEAERQVAVAKGWTTWQARELIIEARERCGAQGLLPVNGIIAAAQDIEGTITAEGDNLALWAKAGAELLLAADTEPAAAHGGELTDPATRQALLHAAEQAQLARARTRLRAAPAGDSLRRWNAAAPAALAAVTVRAERAAGAALLAAAERASDPRARAALYDLHQLFTLRRVDAAGGLLLSGHHLTAAQLAELPDLVEQSIGRLADQAAELVAAFDLPEEFFATRPIATPGYQEAFEDAGAHWNLAASA